LSPSKKESVLKSKLILITVLALGAMAHAQDFASKLSLSVGLQGVFPAATFTKSQAEIFNPASTQDTTKSVGALGSARLDFGRHSAIDIAVTVNRNSELFYQGTDTGSIFTRVQTNNAEIIGSYIFRLPANPHVKPYAMLGGGAVRFSPNSAFTTAGVPQTDTKPAFAYGFGVDFPFNEHWALRLQYRGLVRSEPDFKLSSLPFGTGLKVHVAEPSIQVVYHF
jgi:opacity protein-like surface antigen